MPHTTIVELKRARESWKAVSDMAYRLMVVASSATNMKEILLDSVFNLTNMDNHWTMEFDFSPAVNADEKGLQEFTQFVSQQTNDVPDIKTEGVKKVYSWENRKARLQVRVILNHQPKTAAAPETLEEGADGTQVDPKTVVAKKKVK